MKTLKICIFLLVSLLLGCEVQQDKPVLLQQDEGIALDWPAMIENLDLSGGAILVPADASLQEALEHMRPGELILEAGEGNEPLIHELTEDMLYREKARRASFMERTDLGGGVAHYTLDIPMGPGEYDVVRIHRVVKERRPYKPVRCRGNIFMVHGAIQDFDDIFLTAGAAEINASTSAPYYMASRGVDVWGIDLAWNMIPADCPDLSFLEDWGMDKDIDHVMKAMSIARFVRVLSGQGWGKMNLLGFSYSVGIAYAAAGYETQEHGICRDISGIISADYAFKYGPDDADQKAAACTSAANLRAAIAAGVYGNDGGQGFAFMASLALSDPQGPSPFYGGLNNMQAMVAVASMNSPFWHYLGGTLEDGLYFSDIQRFLNLGVNLAAWQPIRTSLDFSATLCEDPEHDVPFDDYLEEIRVPIFCLGAAGGNPNGDWVALNRTSSSDVSSFVVDMEGHDQDTDFGHADLWMAYDAADLVWCELYRWLVSH